MKVKILVLPFMCMFYLSNIIYGQDLQEKNDLNFGLKINPVSILLGAASVSTEIFISHKNSLQFNAQYWTGFVPIYPIFYSFTRINGVSVAFRHYNIANIRRSGFIEPFVRYNNLWEVNQRGKVKIYSIGIIYGKQWISKNNLSFEIFAGPYYSKPVADGFDPQRDTRIVISKTINEVGKNPYNGIWLRAGITLGAFF